YIWCTQRLMMKMFSSICDSIFILHYMCLIVCAIDPGITSCGFAVAKVETVRPIKRLEICTVDLKYLTDSCDRKSCTLYHSCQIADRVTHLCQAFPVVHSCDILLIEQQPIAGLTDIQNVLYLLISNREKIKILSA